MGTSVKNAHCLTFAIAIAVLSGAAQATTITGSYGPSPSFVNLTAGTDGWVRIEGGDNQTSGGSGLTLFTHVTGTYGSFVSETEANGSTSFYPDLGQGPTAGSRYPVVGGPINPQPVGTGYQITVTNSSAFAQTLSVYTGQYAATSNLSAGDFTGSNISAGTDYGVWTINIPANYGPLTVNYLQSGTPNVYSNLSVFGATVVAVPEPSSIALLGMGGAGLLAALRRRRK